MQHFNIFWGFTPDPVSERGTHPPARPAAMLKEASAPNYAVREIALKLDCTPTLCSAYVHKQQWRAERIFRSYE